MNKKLTSDIPAPLDCLVMWFTDSSLPISLCCKAPIEFRELPERLEGGRKPSVKRIRRCSRCKTYNYNDYRSAL